MPGAVWIHRSGRTRTILTDAEIGSLDAGTSTHRMADRRRSAGHEPLECGDRAVLSHGSAEFQ